MPVKSRFSSRGFDRISLPPSKTTGFHIFSIGRSTFLPKAPSLAILKLAGPEYLRPDFHEMVRRPPDRIISGVPNVTRHSKSANSLNSNDPPKPAGVIAVGRLYTIAEAKARLGWSDSAFRAAKRRGLRLLLCGKRRYITGDEVLRFLESIQETK